MVKEALLRQRDSDLVIRVAPPSKGTASNLTAWATKANARTVHLDGENFTGALLNSITVNDATSDDDSILFTANFGDAVQFPGDRGDSVVTFLGCLVNDHRVLCLLRGPDSSLSVCRPSAIDTVTATTGLNGMDVSELKQAWAHFFDAQKSSDGIHHLRPRINKGKTQHTNDSRTISEPSDPGEDSEGGSDENGMAVAAEKEKTSRMAMAPAVKKAGKARKKPKQARTYTCYCNDCAGNKYYLTPKTVARHMQKDRQEEDQQAFQAFDYSESADMSDEHSEPTTNSHKGIEPRKSDSLALGEVQKQISTVVAAMSSMTKQIQTTSQQFQTTNQQLNADSKSRVDDGTEMHTQQSAKLKHLKAQLEALKADVQKNEAKAQEKLCEKLAGTKEKLKNTIAESDQKVSTMTESLKNDFQAELVFKLKHKDELHSLQTKCDVQELRLTLQKEHHTVMIESLKKQASPHPSASASTSQAHRQKDQVWAPQYQPSPSPHPTASASISQAHRLLQQDQVRAPQYQPSPSPHPSASASTLQENWHLQDQLWGLHQYQQLISNAFAQQPLYSPSPFSPPAEVRTKHEHQQQPLFSPPAHVRMPPTQVRMQHDQQQQNVYMEDQHPQQQRHRHPSSEYATENVAMGDHQPPQQPPPGLQHYHQQLQRNATPVRMEHLHQQQHPSSEYAPENVDMEDHQPPQQPPPGLQHYHQQLQRNATPVRMQHLHQQQHPSSEYAPENVDMEDHQPPQQLPPGWQHYHQQLQENATPVRMQHDQQQQNVYMEDRHPQQQRHRHPSSEYATEQLHHQQQLQRNAAAPVRMHLHHQQQQPSYDYTSESVAMEGHLQQQSGGAWPYKSLYDY
jgi:hypothetical protein